MPKEIVGRGWSFPPHIGVQGGFSLTNEINEVEQAMVVILATSPGERVMRPTFGSRLQELIFEPCNAHTLSIAEEYTREALAMWEPRIEVDAVMAYVDDSDTGRIIIEVEYTAKNSNDPRSLVYPFYTIPGE